MKLFILKLSILASFLLLNISCSGGDSSTHVLKEDPIFEKYSLGDDGTLIASLRSCDAESRLSFIDELFHDIYYWAELTPSVNIDNYDNNDTLLLDDLINEKDRFSFILDKSDYDDYFNNNMANDYGYLNLYLDKNSSIVYFVYPNSPANDAGIKRSDIILNSIPLDDNKSAKFTILTQDGITKELTITTKPYRKMEVTNTKIISVNDHKIGYLNLNSFVGENIESDLDKAFLSFKDKIDELVLDLRYNSGGSINLAAHLASLIAGKKSFSHVFQYHQFNENYSSSNDKSYFDKSANLALNLDRVFILVSKHTASASESLISALRASENKMDVILIGSQTYGKPYSMYAIEYCNKVIFPILMKNLNTDFAEDYDDGFKPTCSVSDDLTHDFSDENESLLSEAIYYINNQSCSNR